MRRGLALLLGAAGAAGAYAAWSRVGRAPPSEPLDPRLDDHLVVGSDMGAGNLLAVQPYVVPSDYARVERLIEKVDRYLSDAREHGCVNERTVVVLPEHLGTWLFAADEKRAVYSRADMAAAAALVVARNLPSFVRALLRADVEDSPAYALFRCKAQSIADAWLRAARAWATRHRVTVVAGSALLPSPRLEGGELVVGDGALYDVALVVGPDGATAGPLVKKCFLDVEERGWVRAGLVGELPTFETPAGVLGVLVGRDAFQPTAHGALLVHGIDLLAVPAYLAGHEAWTSPWRGFAGGATPPDIDPADEGRILEAEAWLEWGPPYRLRQCGARASVTAFLKGCLWDRPSDGAVLASTNGVTTPGPVVAGGSWVCQWLEG